MSSHMLNNNGLCLRAAAQYILLLLVWFNNSDRFQIYRVTRSYSSRLFLCTLATTRECSFIMCPTTTPWEYYFDYCRVTCLTTTAGFVRSLSLLCLLLLYISQQSLGSLSKLALARRTEGSHACSIQDKHTH